MKIGRRDLLISGGAFLGAISLGLAPVRADAHEYDIGKLKVEHPWLRAPKDDNAKKAYFYAFIHNSGGADRLIGVKSPHFGSVEFHSDDKHTNAPKGIEIPANKTITLAPNGPHVVLLDLKKHIEVGWGLEIDSSSSKRRARSKSTPRSTRRTRYTRTTRKPWSVGRRRMVKTAPARSPPSTTITMRTTTMAAIWNTRTMAKASSRNWPQNETSR